MKGGDKMYTLFMLEDKKSVIVPRTDRQMMCKYFSMTTEMHNEDNLVDALRTNLLLKVGIIESEE